MDKYKVVSRGRITYYLSDSSILVSIKGGQCISYNLFNSPVRSGLTDFKKKILTSKETEYDNALDQMDLARKCNLIGSSIRRPDWMEEQ